MTLNNLQHIKYAHFPELWESITGNDSGKCFGHAVADW